MTVEVERDWSDPAASQGTPRVAGNHQKLREEAWDRFFPRAFLENMALPTLLAFRTVREYTSVVLKHPVYGAWNDNLRKLIHI